jgi:S1-C subfamily serine protease
MRNALIWVALTACGGEYRMTRDQVVSLLNDPELLAETVRFVPHLGHGGVRIFVLNPKPLLAQIGFQGGDTILSVNGEAVDSLASLEAWLTSLGEVKHVAVRIRRRDRIFTMRFAITGGPHAVTIHLQDQYVFDRRGDRCLVNRGGVKYLMARPEHIDAAVTAVPQGLQIHARSATWMGFVIGIQDGDIVASINGRPTPSLEALRDSLQRSIDSNQLRIEIITNRKIRVLDCSVSD